MASGQPGTELKRLMSDVKEGAFTPCTQFFGVLRLYDDHNEIVHGGHLGLTANEESQAGKTDWFQPGRSSRRAQGPAAGTAEPGEHPDPRSENLNGTDQAIHAASHPAPPQPQSVFPPLWTTHRAAENLPAGQDPHSTHASPASREHYPSTRFRWSEAR
jgi:hypothetical protein